MAKPDPQGGLVIRYDYLWSSEEQEGREEGSKVRPCAIVLALAETRDGARQVVVCGITHQEPRPPHEGVEIPLKVKRHLGLDDERSWAVVSEGNLVDWDDPGIEPIAPGQWTYGFVPQELAAKMARTLLARYRSGQLPLVNRPKIELRRIARDADE